MLSINIMKFPVINAFPSLLLPFVLAFSLSMLLVGRQEERPPYKGFCFKTHWDGDGG